MEPNQISREERDKLTGQAANLFKARNPEYYPSPANSDKLVTFVESQIGMPLLDFPCVVTADMWQAAYDHIKKTSWFYERPVEVEVEDPAVTRERLAQERVRTEHAARVAADKIARDKAMPLSDLRNVVGVQNKDFREQRDQNLLPVRSTGMESRAVSTVQLGVKAQARVNVGLANRGLDTHSAEFTRLYAAELNRLRNQ
jgi:hypothetical protein